MLSDYILIQLLVFVEEYLGLVQFTFLELVLSSSKDPVAIANSHEGSVTLLTGSVDYAIMSSAGPKADVAKSLQVETGDVDKSELWNVWILP
jgi:hypothetical protein